MWLLFSSVVLAFAFVFGNSIRQLYEAVIFLFVIHPYDVGDWLMISNNQYQVKLVQIPDVCGLKMYGLSGIARKGLWSAVCRGMPAKPTAYKSQWSERMKSCNA